MSEISDYYHFTGPQRRDKALHTLIGILAGIAADGIVTSDERRELDDWLVMNDALSAKCPAFAELCRAARAAVQDGLLTREELDDLLALSERAKSTSEYFGAVTHRLQELHGMLHGIIADGEIRREELQALQSWIEDNAELRSLWPLSEVETLVISVLSREALDEAQRLELQFFFAQFANLSAGSKLQKAIQRPERMTVKGICATDPLIVFEGRGFCFTGLSTKATRAECHEAVARKGGFPKNQVSSEVHYLVVHEGGNPCWAYSCYGRKVEAALGLRERGQPVLIIQERDFWDALN